MIFRITADTTTLEFGITTFEVEADSKEDAIKKIKQGEAEEVDWSTHTTEIKYSNHDVE